MILKECQKTVIIYDFMHLVSPPDDQIDRYDQGETEDGRDDDGRHVGKNICPSLTDFIVSLALFVMSGKHLSNLK